VSDKLEKMNRANAAPLRWFMAFTVSCLSLVLMGVPAAFAHVPSLEPAHHADAVLIEGPEASRAVYGYLAPGEPSDAYRFRMRATVTREIAVIVPAYREHADFRPTLVIAAENGPAITIRDPGDTPRHSEFEPFSLTSFWKGGEHQITFEAGRTYTVRVEPGGGSVSGRYVVVFGGPERFDASDTIGTVRRLPAIWLGAYGGAPARWNWLALIPFGFAAAAVWAVVVAARKLVSRERAKRRPSAPARQSVD
jgi:hypothetical protein